MEVRWKGGRKWGRSEAGSEAEVGWECIGSEAGVGSGMEVRQKWGASGAEVG